MFLRFVFQARDRCFQLVGSRVDLLHFIFEGADMSIPRIFRHFIALPRCVPPHRRTITLPGARGAHMQLRVVGSSRRLDDWETPTALQQRPRYGIRRSSYDASRRFKAVTVPGFAFILRQTPFSSYDSLSTTMFLRISASTPSLP